MMSCKVTFAAGDEIELRAIADVFGHQDRYTAVSSTKGATGALLARCHQAYKKHMSASPSCHSLPMLGDAWASGERADGRRRLLDTVTVPTT